MTTTTDVRLIDLSQSNWSRFTWAACYDCCWAEWFRATSGPRHHTIYRILP